MSEYDYNWIKYVDDVNRTLNTFSTPMLNIDGGSPIPIERSYGVQLKKATSSPEFRIFYKEESALGIGSVKYLPLIRVNSINGIRPGNYKYGFTERKPDWDSSETNRYKM
ncbi:hypothetical protein [Companilactobacillus kimchiensis]|uniref:Uncharacterized protein n=1 Tax=Companilactobacillus kimchiensis TaxID=993692 RepID=A0A0R2LFT4_9LACO|nr:hypothetical protein [Companilactobacillus kimchiensis]KRO00776.1 hypothetical protein IV57_GL000096 [Companilactobacillus kimchiensis]